MRVSGHLQVVERGEGRRYYALWRDAEGRHKRLLGPAWSEELLCATATALEEVTPWAAQKPQPARQ